MIEEEIDHDSGESSARGCQEALAFTKDRVVIGKTIDGPVKHDTFDQIMRMNGSQKLGSAPDKVAQQGPDPRGIGRKGEMEMSKEVQGLLR